MSSQIVFDDLLLDTVVTNQYISRGIEFTVPGIIAFDSSAPTPNHVLQATDRSGALEFPDWHISGRFLSPTHSHIGLSATSARLTVFDAAGAQIGSTRIPSSVGYTYGEIFAGEANIASFDITAQGGSPFRIDNFIFDDVAVPQQPDFRLVYTGGPIFMKPGRVAFATISVVRLNGSRGPIDLTVSRLPSSVIATLTPNPFTGVNGDTVTLGFQASLWSNSNPVVTGHHVRVSGAPWSEAGTRIRTVDVPITVQEPYDAQIVGLEVTQAVQPFGLPAKSEWTQVTPVQYTGVPLAEGGMTRVRVFCTWRRLGRQNSPSFDLNLYGFLNGSSLAIPGGPLKPQNYFLPLGFGDDVSPGARAGQTADFVLPESWAREDLTLRAELRIGLNFTPEANFDTELDNNVFTLMHIPFIKMVDLHIVPFQLRIAGHYLDPPWRVFEQTVSTLPLGARQVFIGDYSNVVDITDIALDSSRDADEKREDAASRLSYAVNDWNYGATPRQFLVGVYSSDKGGVMGPLAMGDGFLESIWNSIIGKQRVAIVEDYARPLSSVAHEINHLCGRPHAGQGEPPVESWPPDEQGLLDGVGVDRRDGQIRYPGTGPHGPFYDFMSYAPRILVGDPNLWISVKGWNALFNWFRPGILDHYFGRLVPSPSHMTAFRSLTSSFSTDELDPQILNEEKLQQIFTQALTLSPSRELLTIFAIVSSPGSARITRVLPEEDQYPLEGPVSEYRVVVKDMSGTLLASASPLHWLSTEGSNSTSIKVSVALDSHAAAAVVELYHKDVLIARRHRPNNAPTVTKVSIGEVTADASTIPGREVTWYSTHRGGLGLEARVDLLRQSSLDRSTTEWHNIYTGPAKSLGQSTTSRLPASLFPANPCARVRVRVSDGFNEATQVSDEFECAGSPPRVRIVYPRCGASFAVGSNVYLHAEAIDDRQRWLPRPDAEQGCGAEQREGVCWTVNGKSIGEDVIESWIPGLEMRRFENVKVKFEAVDYLGRSSCSEICLHVTGR